MIYLALGRRRLGKTTLACYMATRVPYRVMFDPRGLIPTDTPRVRSADQLRAITAIEGNEERRVADIVITPESNLQDTFNTTARYVKQWSRTRSEPLFFLIDEARFVDVMDSDSFEYLIRAADPSQIHIMLTAHRPADIDTNIRAISDHWLLFRSTQEHDLKVIEERCGLAVRRRVQQLKRLEFVHWNDAEGQWSANTNPSSWYVPLSTPSREPDEVIPDFTDKTRLL